MITYFQFEAQKAFHTKLMEVRETEFVLLQI